MLSVVSTEHRKRPPPRVALRDILRVTWPQLCAVLVLLLLNAACIWLLSATRTYVGGEGLWGKARRDAVASLLGYADTADSHQLQRYRAAIRVPLGDKRARLELQKDVPDYAVARAGLLEGRNPPEDLTGVIAVFRLFGSHPAFARAVALWTDGDEHIAQLEAAARELEALFESRADPQSVKRIRQSILDTSAELAPLEDAFSVAISQASRELASLLFFFQAVMALSLAVVSLHLTRKILTRERAIEQDFREVSHSLDLATRGSNDGFWDWDFRRRRMFHSEHFRQQLDLPGATGPRRAADMWRIVHPLDRGGLRRAIRMHLAGRSASLDIEVRLRVGETSYRPFHVRGRIWRDADGPPQHLSGAITDIAARLDAEAAVKESENLLRGVFEAANDVVLVIDGSGRVRIANPAIQTMFGYSVEEMIGAHVTILQASRFEGADVRGFYRYLRSSGSNRREWHSMHTAGRRKNGDGFPMDVSYSEIEIQDRKMFAIFLRDMSSWTQAQQEVIRTRQLLDTTQTRFERVLIAELEAQQTQIAQELHDSLGSELAALSLVLGGSRAMATSPQLAGQIDLALSQVQSAAQMTRALAHGLMPVGDHAGAFWRALEGLAGQFKASGGMQCEFVTDGDVDEIPSEAGTHLYRIAQEALANAVRHGQATHIRMTLSRHEAGIRLSIADNGVGFASQNPEEPKGLGLRSMLARSKAIGADIQFLGRQPTGTEVRVDWALGKGT